MAFSHTITVAVQPASAGVSRSKSYSGSQETSLSETIAVGTDTPIYTQIDVTAVKSFYIVSDRAVTLETNDGSSPDDTLVLKAGVPYIWNTDSYDTFQLTADVVVIYVTNASGASANIEMRCIQDATP